MFLSSIHRAMSASGSGWCRWGEVWLIEEGKGREEGLEVGPVGGGGGRGCVLDKACACSLRYN